MFIMYPNSKGDSTFSLHLPGPSSFQSQRNITSRTNPKPDVTVSPRIGSSGAEPTFNSSIDLSILPGTTINDSMLILKARCGNCRDYMNTKAESQPMIYAFGNGKNLMSNSRSANLARHFGYGSFTMNLRAANGPGGVPAKSNARNGVEMQGEMTRDHDRANLAHAIMGCLALFILWPLNLIAVAVFKNIKIHVMFSVIILVFLIVSFALGGVVSGQYNRVSLSTCEYSNVVHKYTNHHQSKAFNTPHQIFALIAILPLLLMSLLPAFNHINARLRSLHTPLASTSFVLLVLTGGLGLQLSSQTRPIILVYTSLSLGIFMFLILMHTCIHRRGSAYARALTRGSNDDAIMLAKMDECRSIPSAGGFGNQPPPPYPPPYGNAHVNGAQHQRNGSRSMYGGGTMPGPQYLLNMHPGVPVQVSRM